MCGAEIGRWHNINSLWDRLPEELRKTPEAKFLYEFGCVTTMDIVELICRPMDPRDFRKTTNSAEARCTRAGHKGWSTRKRRCSPRHGLPRCRPRSVRAPLIC